MQRNYLILQLHVYTIPLSNSTILYIDYYIHNMVNEILIFTQQLYSDLGTCKNNSRLI